jgi:NAD-dependent dihydropyrimidine dehydrogenase PreA subunit
MTYVITEACIGVKDRSCVDVCPVACIYEAPTMLVIAPSECIDCGACVPECPTEAIFALDDLPPDQADFVAVNAVWEDGGEEAVEAAIGARRTASGPAIEASEEGAR